MSKQISRREFAKRTIVAGMGTLGISPVLSCVKKQNQLPGDNMRLGFVTYLWGKDWDLPTVIANCAEAKFAGVELRTKHAHGVEPTLNKAQRAEVAKRFADSPVTCVGYGSNQEFHSPDPQILEKNIRDSFDLVKLCHDIGASGLKVKPNTLPKEIAPEKTIEQIGLSLNKIGKFAADYGQQIRVEVHGRITSELPNMKAIFEHVDQPNVGMCWNCNGEDLLPPGLEGNFNLVKDRFGNTVHVRELNSDNYPYQELFNLFVAMDYQGWILLEARTDPEDKVTAMKEQFALFNTMIENARSAKG